MNERNDDKLIEDSGVDFAMYCDTRGLNWQEGVELAEKVADEIEASAALRNHPDIGAPELAA